MKISVRSLEHDDKSQWEPLWLGYLEFYKTELPERVTEATWFKLMDKSRDPHGMCALDQSGNMVGIVHYLYHQSTWSIEHVCYLNDLFVIPNMRGSGAGRALINAVYEEAARAGAVEVYWLTQEFNETARALYDKVAKKTPFVHYAHTPK